MVPHRLAGTSDDYQPNDCKARVDVPHEKLSWDVHWPEYEPLQVAAQYRRNGEQRKGFEDEDCDGRPSPEVIGLWKKLDHKTLRERGTYEGVVPMGQNLLPLNPYV